LKIKANHLLYAFNILTAVLFVVIALLPNNVLRIILGLPVVLFFPGYTLLAALFPRKDSLGDIERFALSFGISIAVVPLIGLGLNYTPWGIRLYPIMISLFVFILVMSGIAWYRNRKLPDAEKISINVNTKIPSLPQLWSAQSARDKIITVVLVILVIGAAGTLAYVATRPRSPEKFTEFYVLNDQGKAENYPSTIYLGNNAQVILGTINHENAVTTYKIEVTLDGDSAGEIGPFDLKAEEKREQYFIVTPAHKGDKQELLFSLYKGDSADIYESLHLWINVPQ
jgi:uncharacterized membrane protein